MVSSTPRPHFTPGKDTVPILQEAGWAPGPVWTGGKSRPHRDSIPDLPAHSQSLHRLSYPAHNYECSSRFYLKTNLQQPYTRLAKNTDIIQSTVLPLKWFFFSGNFSLETDTTISKYAVRNLLRQKHFPQNLISLNYNNTN